MDLSALIARMKTSYRHTDDPSISVMSLFLYPHFRHFRCDSMQRIYEAILYDLTKNLPLPELDTS